MNRTSVILLVSLIMTVAGSVGHAQTPTPLPGTPQALTCVAFTSSPGLPGVEIVDSWEFLDRACIVMENTTGTAIEIAGCQGYFGRTVNPLEVHIRIWQIHNESLLPDLQAAASQVSETYAFAASPVPGSPQVSLITFDLEHYPDGYAMPLIDSGRKFVVEFMNMLDESGSGIIGMKIAAEFAGQCPPTYWADETNLFYDFDEATPANSDWYFKEDIGNSTNYYMGVTYYDNAIPRTPSMGTFGILGILGFITLAMTRRRKGK